MRPPDTVPVAPAVAGRARRGRTRTDGGPDPRPDGRENAAVLGNLALDFDFSQPPVPPVILPVNPPPDLRR